MMLCGSLRFSPKSPLTRLKVFDLLSLGFGGSLRSRRGSTSVGYLCSARNNAGLAFSQQIGQQTTPLSGLDDELLGYISGNKKATEVAHSIWKRIVQKGDTVVDATCGNGHDTLALLKMVADGSGKGSVYGMDIQNCALENTSTLIKESSDPNEVELVKLFNLCHSSMEEIVPKGILVRLVAFNLGYLPGGDKSIITLPERTLQALEAASRLLEPEGLISIMVYVGHPGGRDEYAVVQAFASQLLVEEWVCCKFEMVNRPAAPVLFLLFRK
ncbi:hypothetical protein Sjap_026252 [Stephania japonica]|uniref:rRNA methylase YtqB n=1 Tax=Stephania japonica TaxID=461633 RepID=A0AAP0E390_9MAGN